MFHRQGVGGRLEANLEEFEDAREVGAWVLGCWVQRGVVGWVQGRLRLRELEGARQAGAWLGWRFVQGVGR